MKKLFILFSVFIYSLSAFSQVCEDTVYTVVTNDSIIIMDNNAWRNMRSRWVMSAYKKGNDITVLETDTAKNPCRCGFNVCFGVTIAMLPQGNYNVFVKDTGLYFIDQPCPLLRTTSFVIDKSNSAPDSISIISLYYNLCSEVSVKQFKNENSNLSVFPNPVDNISTITFQLEKPSLVSLKLYDLAGKELASLINERMTNGKHDIVYNNQLLKSGIYLLRLITPDKSETIKLSVIKN